MMPPSIRFIDLCSILDFIYLGHANVPQNRLDDFIKAGEMFQIRGIKEGRLHFLNQTQQHPQQFQTNSSQPQSGGKPILVQQTSVGGGASVSFEPVITSTQDPTSVIMRPPSKRLREDDEQDISIQEASEIMKMLLDHPELDDHPIKAEQLKDGQVQNQQMQMKTEITDIPPVQQHPMMPKAPPTPTPACVKPKFLCRFCGRGLSTKGRVQKHENECNDNPQRTIVFCELCSNELKPSSLTHHMNAKHGIKPPGKTPKHNASSTSTSPKDGKVAKSTSNTSTTSTMSIPPAFQSPDGNQLSEGSPEHSSSPNTSAEEIVPKTEIDSDTKVIVSEKQINVD